MEQLQQQPRILIVDDDQALAAMLSTIFEEEGYKVAVFNSSKDVLYLARQFRPDLMLLDLMMPEVDGCGVCRFFRTDADLRYTRIIVLTGRDDIQTRIQCYTSGADLYLSKPFNGEELIAIVRSVINSRKLHEQLVTDLQERGMIDSTANCYTSKFIAKRTSEELKRVDRYHHPLSLVLFDLDHFKTVNLRFGYEFGNHVLKSISEAIRGQIRECDALGRYGEDSFLLVLPETDTKGARRVASRLKDTIASLVFVTKKRLAIRCTTAHVTVESPTKLEDAFKRLDDQLKKAQSLKFGKRS